MRTLSVLALMLILPGCQQGPGSSPRAGSSEAGSAEFRDTTGRTVGRASLSEVGGGVRLVIDVAGLPSGEKGFHIHEVGRCDPPSFESAGNHFNPTGKEHGTANPRGPHAGDLPNITVDASGRGHLDVTTERISLRQGSTSVFDADGSAIIVHAAPDDMRSDPAGNSGTRIACAVIVRVSAR